LSAPFNCIRPDHPADVLGNSRPNPDDPAQHGGRLVRPWRGQRMELRGMICFPLEDTADGLGERYERAAVIQTNQQRDA